MWLKKIKFESLSPQRFWPKYHQKSVAILAMHAEKWAAIKKEGDWDEALQGIDVFIGDGVGLLLGYWLLTGKKIIKCSGVDLIDTLIEQFPKTSVFLWGAKPGVAQAAAKSYQERGLQVVGFQDGYSGKTENILGQIKKSGAKLVMVGMSGRKQAELVSRVHAELGISAMSVGGSFDVASGGVKRSPKIFQKLGLEWLWRMVIEPKRFKRLPMLFRFVWYIILERMGLKI